MLISPLSILFLIILVMNSHNWPHEGADHYEAVFAIYVLLALPFLYLRLRRFVQSRRERREYRAENSSSENL